LSLLLNFTVQVVPYESHPHLSEVFRKSLYLRLTRQQHPFEISIPTQMQVSRHFIHKYFHHDKSPQQNQLPLNYHLKNHLSYHNSSDFNHLQAILYPLVAIVILNALNYLYNISNNYNNF
jgi:hypothetical protein